MKSSASRDAMNARVSDAFEKWPSFLAMPQTQAAGRRVAIRVDLDDQQNYVKALYACCYDSVPIGRDGVSIVGEPVADDELDATPRGRRLTAG